MAAHTVAQQTHPDNLHDWQAREYQQAYTEDQQRPGTGALKTVARYARLDDLTEGYAIRTPDRKVFFLDGTSVTELTNADIPRLTLLGDVELVEAQQVFDNQRGTLAHITTSRKMEG
jgi:hypothetical protein